MELVVGLGEDPTVHVIELERQRAGVCSEGWHPSSRFSHGMTVPMIDSPLWEVCVVVPALIIAIVCYGKCVVPTLIS